VNGYVNYRVTCPPRACFQSLHRRQGFFSLDTLESR